MSQEHTAAAAAALHAAKMAQLNAHLGVHGNLTEKLSAGHNLLVPPQFDLAKLANTAALNAAAAAAAVNNGLGSSLLVDPSTLLSQQDDHHQRDSHHQQHTSENDSNPMGNVNNLTGLLLSGGTLRTHDEGHTAGNTLKKECEENLEANMEDNAETAEDRNLDMEVANSTHAALTALLAAGGAAGGLGLERLRNAIHDKFNLGETDMLRSMQAKVNDVGDGEKVEQATGGEEEEEMKDAGVGEGGAAENGMSVDEDTAAGTGQQEQPSLGNFGISRNKADGRLQSAS